MSLILKLAFLNVLRNKRRTFITVLAIMFGCVSIIIYGGYIEATYVGVKNQFIYSGMGHIQIFKKGYNQFGNIEPEKYMLAPETVEKVQGIISKYPETKIVAKKIGFSGLLNNGNISNGIFGNGVEAEKEYDINHLKDTETIDILRGDKLLSDQIGYVMLGEALADSFDVDTGDSLTLISTTIDGAVNATDIQVGAIVTTGDTEMDQRYIVANLKDIQILKDTQKVTRLNVVLDETESTLLVRKRMEQDFEKAGLSLELKSWNEMADFYHQIVGYYEDAFLVISLIILMVVVIGIANTMTMSVMERTPELGTLRALGNSRGQLVKLVFSESIYIGIIGSALGLAMGIIIAEGITAMHFMQPPPPGCTRGYPYEIFYTAPLLAKTFLIGLSAAFFSCIYPAIKASRLKIVDALRYNQ